MTERPPENGWLADTPVGDTLLRRFVHNEAELNAVVAAALGGRTHRSDDVFLADAHRPVAYFNQAMSTATAMPGPAPGKRRRRCAGRDRVVLR